MGKMKNTYKNLVGTRVRGALSLRVKRPGLEADHSSPSNAEVKECVELYLHSPNMPSWRGAKLNLRDNFGWFRCRRESHIKMNLMMWTGFF
jgi:hypothetical protein